jgi:hypothetical protein
MGIGIVYASDRDRAREKVFGVEALAGEMMMMMKTKFTDIVLGVKKMTNVSSKNHQGSGVLKIHNHTNNPLAATITPNNPSPPLPSPAENKRSTETTKIVLSSLFNLLVILT